MRNDTLKLIRRKLSGVLVHYAAAGVVLAIILYAQDGFGSSDSRAFFLWTLPVSISTAFVSGALLSVLRGRGPVVILTALLICSVLLSALFVTLVWWVLGPWIMTFSFPIILLWFTGILFQLSWEMWRAREEEKRDVKNLWWALLWLPVGFIVGLIMMFAVSYVMERWTRPPAETFVLPMNYEGWIRVVYGEKCGATEWENERILLRIPADGVLLISAPQEYGTIDHEYYYDSSGVRIKLPQLIGSSGEYGVELRHTGTMTHLELGTSLSSESDEAIHYADLYVHGRNGNTPVEYEVYKSARKLDSLTVEKVKLCRGH